MYSVNQPWDKLKVCAVGCSYPPEFYSWVENKNARKVLEKIAEETEEDFQKFINLLHKFNVKVVRPQINPDYKIYLKDGRYIKPPMTPRDHMIMIGNNYCIDNSEHSENYINIIKDVIKQKNKILFNKHVNGSTTIRLGKDLFIGTMPDNKPSDYDYLKDIFPDYRHTIVDVQCHNDAVFVPVVPALIISLHDVQNYNENFPNWEVIYLSEPNYNNDLNFLTIKEKTKGKWWVKGQELNDDFVEFVEKNINHWMGNFEETVFDIGMLVIDKNNVVCMEHNETVFKALENYNITPHVVNFRHKFFWDGSIHCMTSDLDREGEQIDLLP